VPVLITIIVCSLFWWQFSAKIFARGPSLDEQLRKFNYLLYQIRENYVEEPNMPALIDGAINGMLEALDPHSVYIPAEEQRRLNEQFQGEFEGIGISFVIQNKILTVISPIPGTPADRLGIRAGDRIVEINGESTYGITNEQVFQKLRGPKGTTVEVKIEREGVAEKLVFTIVRDKIPIYSVETSFILDGETGYILLNQFTSTTSAELDSTLNRLRKMGMTRLIFDLRGNSGGYLEQAVKVADKFLPKGERIVFTRGRQAGSEHSFYSIGGAYTNLDLIVLINHGSASASEIVAGAVQDLDRGLVAGARSFGKGLEQSQIPFEDGSSVRLTTARYYTPSGRLIQRPFSHNIEDYYREAFEEEDTSAVKIDSTKEVYYTKAGRRVYGGGGIEPDVKLATGYYTSFTSKLLNQRLFFEFAGRYAAEHPELGVDFNRFLNDFNINNSILEDFLKSIESKKITFNDKEYQQDLPYIKNLLKSEMAMNLFNGRQYYYQVRIKEDPQIRETLKLFPQAREIAQLGIRASQKSK
jgi:carboxyl-terminal processing protease